MSESSFISGTIPTPNNFITRRARIRAALTASPMTTLPRESLQRLTTSVPAHQTTRTSLYGRLEPAPDQHEQQSHHSMEHMEQGPTIEIIEDERSVATASDNLSINPSLNLDETVFAAEIRTTSSTLPAHNIVDTLPNDSYALRDALISQGVSIPSIEILTTELDIIQNPMNITSIEREDLREF
jgi:hypothetical protein